MFSTNHTPSNNLGGDKMLKIAFSEDWEWKMIDDENLSEEELSAKKQNLEEWILTVMAALATKHNSKVTFFPYRTASVFDTIFEATRDSMRPLEYMLAIKAGVNPENHTVYEVYDGCQTFYIFCHGNLVRVGKKIKKEEW